jgi:hypothetical protein
MTAILSLATAVLTAATCLTAPTVLAASPSAGEVISATDGSSVVSIHIPIAVPAPVTTS